MGAGSKNGDETAGAASCSERRHCFACRLRAGARREKKEKRNWFSLVTWQCRLNGESFPGATMCGVAGAVRRQRHEHRSNRGSAPV